MTWVLNNLGLIGELTVAHLRQSLIALLAGFVLSVPLGWVAWRYRLVRSSVITITGLLYTIPSLALIAGLWPWLGLSPWTVITALALYALLIILRNMIVGLDAVLGAQQFGPVVTTADDRSAALVHGRHARRREGVQCRGPSMRTLGRAEPGPGLGPRGVVIVGRQRTVGAQAGNQLPQRGRRERVEP